MTTKQDVARYGDILQQIAKNLMVGQLQANAKEQLDPLYAQFNKPVGYQVAQQPLVSPTGVERPNVQQTGGLDQAGLLQALIPLMGSNNPYLAQSAGKQIEAMKLQKDLQPQPKYMETTQGIYNVGGQKPTLEVPFQQTPKEPTYSDVIEGGQPKHITKGGITYKVTRAYSGGQPLPESDPRAYKFEKVDDNTFKPSMYQAGSQDSIQSWASSLADYDVDLNSVPRQDRSAVFAEAKKLNPKFNQATYDAARRLKLAYTSGKQSQNITSLNTAIGHVGQLAEVATALNNGDIQPLNIVANWYKQQTGKDVPAKFEAVRDAVANEIATAFKGSSGTDIGLQKILSTINSAQSPQQLMGVVVEDLKLLKTRLNVLNEQYKKATGKDFKVIDDEQQAILDKYLKPTQSGSTIKTDRGTVTFERVP